VGATEGGVEILGQDDERTDGANFYRGASFIMRKPATATIGIGNRRLR
jgi:hypothetical protein